MPDRSDAIAFVVPPFMDFLLDPVLDKLRRRRTRYVRFRTIEELLQWQGIGGATILVAFECTAEVLERASLLKALINPTTGCERIDLASAAAHGVVVGTGQVPENYIGMAEGAFLLILAALYDLPRMQRAMDAPARSASTARMMQGKTIGIVGYGLIAQALARRFEGWDVELLVYARSTPQTLAASMQVVELDDLLARSDVVTLHCSLNEDSRNLIDERCLALMKPGAVFVNTARGGLVDEQALARAAASGAIGTVALDVFQHEPLPATSSLRALGNAILTPHRVGHSRESEQALRDNLIVSIDRVLAGNSPCHIALPVTAHRRSTTAKYDGVTL